MQMQFQEDHDNALRGNRNSMYGTAIAVWNSNCKAGIIAKELEPQNGTSSSSWREKLLPD